MKINTYTASGYKYGLVSYPSTCTMSLAKALEQMHEEENQNSSPRMDQEKVITIDKKYIIDFHQVDGLTLEDMKDYQFLLLDNRFLVFIMYDSIDKSFPAEYEQATIRYFLVIDTKKEKEKTIDSIIAEHLRDNIQTLNNTNRKRAAGFLEEFKYDTKETVSKMIQYMKV